MANQKSYNPNIARIIKETLERERIGVEKAAEALGVSKQAVSRYQNGIDTPGADKVAGWVDSGTRWVSILGQEIWFAQFGMVAKCVLGVAPEPIQPCPDLS
jgi:transcriptional regulator with XRE-family HTH domain